MGRGLGTVRSGVKEDWRGLAHRLAARREVVVFDNRGLGESDDVDDAYDMASLADDVLALADHLAWRTFALLGISFGGMIAQHAAIRATPGRVRRLVLGCTSFGGTCRARAHAELPDKHAC